MVRLVWGGVDGLGGFGDLGRPGVVQVVHLVDHTLQQMRNLTLQSFYEVDVFKFAAVLT